MWEKGMLLLSKPWEMEKQLERKKLKLQISDGKKMGVSGSLMKKINIWKVAWRASIIYIALALSFYKFFLT